MQCIIVFFLWTIFSVILQTQVLSSFPSVYVFTDPVFYLIVILGLRFRLLTGFIVALVLGYVSDTVSFAPYGTYIISYVATLLFIRKVKLNIYIESRSSIFFWLLAFSLFRQLVQFTFFYLVIDGYRFGASRYVLLLLQSLWDAALGVILVPFLDRLLFTEWGSIFKRKGIRDS